MDPRPLSELFEQHILPEIRDTISELEEFVQISEDFLDSLHRKAFDAFVRKERELGVTVLPDGTSLRDFFNKHFAAWPEGRLVDLLRQSLFVALYAFIESSLMELCRTLQRKDVGIRVTDLKGQNHIDKAKSYFTKVLLADFPASSSEWAEIQIFRRLRNCIVHNAAELSPDSTDRPVIERYSRQHPALVGISGRKIVLESESCRRVLHIFRSFVDLLAGSLIPYVTANEANLEPFPKQFGEFYIGQPLAVWYIPEPDDHDPQS